MVRYIWLGAFLFIFFSDALTARYRVKEILVKPASEYPDHMDFQNLVIGALPCPDVACSSTLFDTDRLPERGIMAVLVVVQNNNDFAVRIHDEDIFLVMHEGTNRPSLRVTEVLIRVAARRGGRQIGPTRPEVQVQQIRDRTMVQDFMHKAFGEKLIAPHDSDYGVVFFEWEAEMELDGTRLYLPSVWNLTEGEPLMFFELDLGRTGQ